MLIYTEDFLKYRHRRASQYFLGEAQKISVVHAFQYAEANWPTHNWGIGQNGSAASIVYHVAAWRQLTLPVLNGAATMKRAEDFMPQDAPSTNDWFQILQWAVDETARWAAALDTLAQSQLERKVDWGADGSPEVASVIWSIIEHDIQHASQLEYLQQRIACAAG